MFEKAIVDNARISPFFVKANLFVTNKYQAELNSATNKDQALIAFWDTEFKAILHVSSTGIFDKVSFKTSKDLLVFNLKFD
jgi:hypothetical protein